MHKWLAVVAVVALALSCIVAPLQIDLSAGSGRRTVTAARTGPAAQHGLSSPGGKPLIRPSTPSPRPLGLFYAEEGFSLATPVHFEREACDDRTGSRLIDQRAMIRRLCRTQHRPPAAPTNA